MGQKREYSEIGSPEPHNRPSFNVAKKHKSSKSKHRPNEGTSTWAKKRTRTIERLLKRNQELPANVRNDLERELGALKATVSDKSFQKLRSAMISKYHMVRFFERKKASRLAKQLRKKIEETESTETGEIEALERDLHVAEVDEAYTQHFPHAEPYISLYTSAKSEKEDEDRDDDKLDYTPLKHRGLLHTERPPIWSEIEQAMKDGPYALRNLRERRPTELTQEAQSERRQKKPHATITDGAPNAQPKPQAAKEKPAPFIKVKGKAASAPKNRRERRLQERQAAQPVVKSDGDDSDEGGFFEED
ncbi:related to rRNA-processing protein efg-1 [Fusarium fujikuroi]|nr:related to rRNA-processing protein efg-1 [Fusarium fujikuroi]